MKKIILLLFLTIALSCSKGDTCEEERNELNAEYDRQVTWVMENTEPINWRQIELINDERNARLNELCN